MIKRELDSSFCELEEDSESDDDDDDEGRAYPGLFNSIIYALWGIGSIRVEGGWRVFI